MRRLTFLLLLCGIPAIAKEADNCAVIADRDERLACFDRLYPRSEAVTREEVREQPEVAAEPAEPVSGAAETPATSISEGSDSAPAAEPVLKADTTPATTPAIEQPAEPPPQPAVAEQAPEAKPSADDAEPEPISRGSLFNDPKVNLTSTIVTIRRGEKQKMVFLLDNDQVWMQSTPRELPFEEGETVTIANATMGGYFMRSKRGLGVRVQRIR